MESYDTIAKIQDMRLSELTELLGEAEITAIICDFVQDQFEAGRITADEILSVYAGDQ